MKIFAYLLIIAGILQFVVTDIIVEKKIKGIPIEQKMRETPIAQSPILRKGRKVIFLYLEARDAMLDIKIMSNRLFVLLFVSGTALLLSRRIKRIERKLDKIEEG